jgi:hypothetical protein
MKGMYKNKNHHLKTLGKIVIGYQLSVISVGCRLFIGEAALLFKNLYISMRIVYKNGPPSNLMRASFTDHYELRTDHFINFSNSSLCNYRTAP